MKIAILTQPLHNNYGGNLQNFALQKVLRDLGHESVTIDRHSPASWKEKLKLGYFKRLVFFALGRGEKPRFEYYFSRKYEAYKREEVIRFVEEYIAKTPRLYSDSEIYSVFIKNKFDAVVVGSDQCWRPSYSPSIYSYFLDFLQKEKDIRKIAYAASFGTDNWEFSPEQTERCKQLVQQFDLVSVREKAAVNLVKEKLNKDAKFALDPTLLLKKEDYENLLKGHDLPSNSGVYTYILDNAKWKSEVVEKVKNKLGLEQYSSQHDGLYLEQKKIPSIESWIKGFADAHFVVTDSFHGTVFSIIFNKPFISLVNISRGASRFESILDELMLMERLVAEFKEEQVDALLNSPINYESVQENLKILRENSISLIKSKLHKL